MNIPSRRDQANTIRQLINENTYKEGEKAYIISNSWLSQWKEAVGYDTGQPTNTNVPKIDNNGLLTNGVLKKALSESLDYVIFSSKIWNTLIKWYGGGPPISVQVDYDPNQQMYVPVVRLSSINVLYNQNKKTFQISKFKTIGDLKKLACKFYSLQYDTHNIYEIWEGKKDTLLDDQKVISQLCLKDGSTLLLDISESPSVETAGNNSNIRAASSAVLPQTNNIVTSSSTIQFSKWISGSESSFHQFQPLANSPSRPTTPRRPSNVQESTFEKNEIENRDPQPTLRSSNRSIQSEGRESTGICGLTNLGNTCFFNSGLQCILHSPILVNYMRTGRYKSDLAPQNPLGTKCQLASAFARLIDQIYKQKASIAAPKEILSVLAFYAPHFAGFAQQDAHELLIFLLDLLHEDLNRAKKNLNRSNHQEEEGECQDIEGDGTNDEEVAKLAWNRYKSKNDSIIVDLFHGLLRSQLICPTCSKKVVIFEPFVTLSLPIPGPMSATPEFTFVPFDPKEAKIRMSIPFSFGLNQHSFRQILNAELGRNFDIAFCTRSHSNGTCEWTNVIPSTYSYSEFIVFEIPEQRSEFYIVSSLVVNRKKGFFGSWLSDNSQILDDLVLIPVSRMYPEKEDLEKACESRLSYLWDTNDRCLFEVSPEFLEFITTIEPFPPEFKKKFDIEISTSFFDRSPIFEKSKIYPFMLNKSLKIKMNPAFMNDYYGFNWKRLLRPVKNVHAKNRESTKPTLENCLNQFCVGTILDDDNMWYCPNCKEFVRANKKTSIWSLPKCLVFQFKRFTQYFNSFRKREGRIEFPNEMDFAPFITGPANKEKTKYRLYAVCEHYGTMSGGHYVAHAFVEEKNNWFFFNDSSVRPSDEQSVHNDDAYLLFYERIDD